MQGLGFRPFVYHLAKKYQQNGWVANSCDGISIVIEGNTTQQQLFITDLQNQSPDAATINSLSIQQKPLTHFSDFQIKSSLTNGEHSAFVLPDMSTCPHCIADIYNPQSRYYHYPFTSCCYCGPRYSIMLQQPYDRIRTSMANFKACSKCLSEYDCPENRRFHSQTIACPDCGPQLRLLDRKGKNVSQQTHALSTAVQLIEQGKIIAIKGIGGFQLLADATNSQAVEELRYRKRRPEKPFALMVENLLSAKQLCIINETEQQALTSKATPIVLLKQLESTCIAEIAAPHLASLGVMLPASPLHHLLTHMFGKPLITTSGNQLDEPICITDQQAINRLGNIADFFLTHNRPIIRALDDSIIRCINNKPVLLRRARGYVPSPISISSSLPDTLALGGQMKNTVAISQGNHLILSQHIGDLHLEIAQKQFKHTITDLQDFYSTLPRSVIHDLHPDYHSSIVASQLEINKMPLQHHHAHILSCMAENNLQTPVLGFAWDGTGLGTDQSIWGGECFLLTKANYQRFACIRPFPLVGGDKAASEPRRSALGLLYEMNIHQFFDNNKVNCGSAFTQQELKMLQQSLEKKINCPYTSSIGRLFDAVSCLLDLSYINQFEGQAAMRLEQLANSCNTEQFYPFNLKKKDMIIIDWKPFISALIADLGTKKNNLIAAKFHNTLAEMAVQIAKYAKLKQIVLSGGCFQNAYLTERCVKQLEKAGFTVYTHEKIPPNDGGLALGQLYAKVLSGN